MGIVGFLNIIEPLKEIEIARREDGRVKACYGLGDSALWWCRGGRARVGAAV